MQKKMTEIEKTHFYIVLQVNYCHAGKHRAVWISFDFWYSVGYLGSLDVVMKYWTSLKMWGG